MVKGAKMKVTKIGDDFYVFRNGIKPTMTVKQMRTGKFVRSDTGYLGSKYVPKDIVKRIQKFIQGAEK